MTHETQTVDGMIDNQAGTDQILTFLLAGEEYGVNILNVQEIKGWSAATAVPNTEDYVLGVINLRGTVVPIIDLRRRFALPPAEFGPTTVVIVMKVVASGREKTVGVVVDAVSDVYNVAADSIRPAPDCGMSSTEETFITGLATFDEKMVILLDMNALMGADLHDTALAS